MSDDTPSRIAFITSIVAAYNFDAIRRVGQRYEIILPRQLYPDMDDAVSRMTDHAEKTLAGFDPAKDVLLLGGDPAAIAICIKVLARKHETFKVGKYDREHGNYYFFDI